MRAAGDGADAQFYAYLYTGLYYEAMGDAERARAADHGSRERSLFGRRATCTEWRVCIATC